MKRAQKQLGLGWAALAVLALAACGCRTTQPLPPVNTAEPGWSLRQGQALWKFKADAPEIAGEVLLASNPDGRTLLQFTKNPFPFVTVQTSNAVWQIEFVPQERSLSGQGIPSPRLSWIHLARALNGGALRPPLHFQQAADGNWQFINEKTGEKISGFLSR